MELNLKVWNGTQLYVFKQNEKFVGCLGVKMPMNAQQILEQVK